MYALQTFSGLLKMSMYIFLCSKFVSFQIFFPGILPGHFEKVLHWKKVNEEVKETNEHGFFSVSGFIGSVSYMAPEFLEYHEQRSTNSTNFFRGSQAADVFRLW